MGRSGQCWMKGTARRVERRKSWKRGMGFSGERITEKNWGVTYQKGFCPRLWGCLIDERSKSNEFPSTKSRITSHTWFQNLSRKFLCFTFWRLCYNGSDSWIVNADWRRMNRRKRTRKVKIVRWAAGISLVCFWGHISCHQFTNQMCYILQEKSVYLYMFLCK